MNIRNACEYVLFFFFFYIYTDSDTLGHSFPLLQLSQPGQPPGTTVLPLADISTILARIVTYPTLPFPLTIIKAATPTFQFMPFARPFSIAVLVVSSHGTLGINRGCLCLDVIAMGRIWGASAAAAAGKFFCYIFIIVFILF